MEKFKEETCRELKHYVYRLIDPRNGHTFYVGKGSNNRIFAHVNNSLKSYVDGKSYLDEENEDETDLKMATIREIHQSGLKVMHIVHKHGMDKDTAIEVESALIDAYYSLTNKQVGHNGNDYGVASAEELENRYAREIYKENKNIPYVIIKTSYERVEIVEGKNYEEKLYNATRHAWRIDTGKAKNRLILSVIGGIVQEAYSADNWIKLENGRSEFEGVVAPDEIRKQFVGYRIPDEFRKKRTIKSNPLLQTKIILFLKL